MWEATGSKGSTESCFELARWFDRAHEPRNPVRAAKWQFDALLGDSEEPPGLGAYDVLYDMANQGLRWLEVNPCPDRAIGRRLMARMMAYRAVADTVRSTLVAADGDAMVAQLIDLREVIDQHAEAIDLLTTAISEMPECRPEDGASILKYRRRVPRQPAGWDGTCRVEGEPAAAPRRCRVLDISMHGLGMTFEHPAPSELVGRRVSIDVPTVGGSVSLRLEGVVRNAVPTSQGAARVGIAFDALSEPAPGTAAAESTSRGRSSTRQDAGPGRGRSGR